MFKLFHKNKQVNYVMGLQAHDIYKDYLKWFGDELWVVGEYRSFPVSQIKMVVNDEGESHPTVIYLDSDYSYSGMFGSGSCNLIGIWIAVKYGDFIGALQDKLNKGKE